MVSDSLGKGRAVSRSQMLWALINVWYLSARLAFKENVEDIRTGSVALAACIIAAIAIGVSCYIGWPFHRYESQSGLYHILTVDVSPMFWAWTWFTVGIYGFIAFLFTRSWKPQFWSLATQAAVWGWVATILSMENSPGGFAAVSLVLCFSCFVIMGLLHPRPSLGNQDKGNG